MTALFVTALLLGAGVPEVEVTTLDGDVIAGRLSRLDSQGAELRTGDGPLTVAGDDLARVATGNTATSSSAAIRITLVDGSTLGAERCILAGESVQTRLASGCEIVLPIREIDAVRFASLASEDEAAWREILARDRPADLLILRRSEALDYAAGLIEEVTESAVVFLLGGRGEPLTVPRERLIGVAFGRPSPPELEETVCRLRTTEGTLLKLADWEAGDEQLSCRTASGMTIDLPWSEVVELDFSQGNVVPLADLSPESFTWTPYLQLHGMTVDDDSPASMFLGGRTGSGPWEDAVLAGRRYARAIRWRSRSEIVYRLTDAYQRFRAVAGIDERTRGAGDVLLTVHGDDRLLLEQLIAPSDAPVAIDVDLTGVGRLIIRVDYAHDGGFGDWLSLCEARLQK